ncbi:beta-ketoacyl-ACP synthase III [Tomitella gaofuii]|uniref:beta-ketoacyl-ACP synthase III n=1 Tax=Tomitella gaofuii TaxID=2760083 RepID=UPI0015FC263E|nr:beta-ketoacyl-ACP synthase III [Tomitella gaofuii]
MTADITPTTGSHSAILSLGVYRPDRVVTNEEICKTIDSTDEWIRTRSGIRSRRFAGPGETSVTMATSAGRKAIEASGLDAEQIDCIIMATSSHYSQTPQAATLVADALGLPGPGSFDLSAGCAGFCHGLAVASDLIRAGSSRHVLVIGVDHMSPSLDMTDRTSAFIFGDGAGAVVVGPSETPKIGPVVWGSDGAQAHAIRQVPTWMEMVVADEYEHPWMRMEGQSVFRWAAFTIGKVAQDALDASSVTVDDLDAFIPHQANQRINELIVRGLKLPESVPVADDIVETANTSAASVPLAMEKMLREGQVSGGGLALLVGFGAGLAYAGQVVRLPETPVES